MLDSPLLERLLHENCAEKVSEEETPVFDYYDINHYKCDDLCDKLGDYDQYLTYDDEYDQHVDVCD